MIVGASPRYVAPTTVVEIKLMARAELTRGLDGVHALGAHVS